MMNCNHGVLSWVAGNDVFLKVRVYEKYLDGEGKTQERAYDLTACDEVVTTLTSAFGESRSVEAAFDQVEDNCVVLHLPYTLRAGQYYTDIRCAKDDLHARSFRIAFAVVNSDCEAQTTFEEIDGCKSANLRVTLQVVAQSEVRGKSAYEEWKELPGNEGKGIQDFIDEVLNLYENAEKARQATEEAENVDAELDGNELTITNRHGVSKTTNTKGEKGDTGYCFFALFNIDENGELWMTHNPLDTIVLEVEDGYLIQTYNI